ncbi:MAG: hypothetical protein KDA47_09285, partial [Planctomycetales bacterium]|nr:hypothetical protein [Planctomycetales bacterium]
MSLTATSLTRGRQNAFVAVFSTFMGLLGMQPGTSAMAAEPTVRRDIEYATVEGHRLLLDLYLPAAEGDVASPPLVVWVHGGAWRAGS